ncbi:hypothetical protein GGR50DRAFT_583336 [Xylaria sp. CBS 124048]|nr:hypothetical protein GGR50DRAFT_583336 [Xylaria sp. CBS 124048]
MTPGFPLVWPNHDEEATAKLITEAMMPPSSNEARQQANPASGGSAAGAYPLLPASPTLTNPDMILPDYDDGGISLDRSQSPLMMWKNTHISGMEFDLSPEAFTAGPVPSATPIIYGNGTMLSDIGEVTEVESTAGPARSRSGSTPSEFALVTSTALQYEAIKQRIRQARMAHQRNGSVGSDSTVTAPHEPASIFADFDDTLSIEDSNFQGDDEDSVADSYIEDISAQGTSSKKLSFDPADERYSSPLSRRAELILANAKRRLSTMEDNLHRARSSLNSPVLSSIGSQSTPSPSLGRPGTAISYGSDDSRRRPSFGHNRISSESIVLAEIKPGASAPRALSALGTSGGYRRHLSGSKKVDYTQKGMNAVSSSQHSAGNAYFLDGKSSLLGHEHTLEPLSEDGTPEKRASMLDAEDAGSDLYLSPANSFSKDQKRPASSTHVRDLKDQVNDLNRRLSTLCDQARADSMERRSLQSLRTPSPFTHARVEQWYAGDTSSHDDGITAPGNSDAQMITDGDGGVQAGSPAEVETAPEPEPKPELKPESQIEPKPAPELEAHLDSRDETQAIQPVHAEETTAPAASNSPDLRQGSPTLPMEFRADRPEVVAEVVVDSLNESYDFDDMRTEDGYEFAEDGDYGETASESGASSYHDTVQVQVSHEDREDAFDYEHFFLHSAMGSMSRRRMRRGSSSSFSSEDSVETTRGPTGLRSRRGSAGSTSTMESFATATEGRHTRVGLITPDENSDEYNNEYPEQVRNLPRRSRTHTPNAGRRMVYTPEASSSGPGSKRLHSSFSRRPQSSAAAFQHRSSVSSVSIGTHRSSQLSDRTQGNRGVFTPDGSPDPALKQISETLMDETASVCEQEGRHDGETVSPIKLLHKDDQILVERVVASLGRCVLGLVEAGNTSAEGRAYRRKIEAARRILTGFE